MTASPKLALYALETLVEAYRRGKRRGGDVDWSDVDVAHELARHALAEERWSKRRATASSELTLREFLALRRLDPNTYPDYDPIGEGSEEVLGFRVLAIFDGPTGVRVIFLEYQVVIVETSFGAWLVA